jgi:hypothetical protein
MARMGRFCKAYVVSALERYPRWSEHARTDLVQRHGDEEPYVFLQEDLTVTADIFADEAVVFDALSPEWERFCRTDLEFAVPEECLADADVEAPLAAAGEQDVPV